MSILKRKVREKIEAAENMEIVLTLLKDYPEEIVQEVLDDIYDYHGDDAGYNEAYINMMERRKKE